MYSHYLELKKLLQPVGFAVNKLLQPVCLLFRENFVKYLIYMASLIMVGLSFGPFIVMGCDCDSWDVFRGEMIDIMYRKPSLFISSDDSTLDFQTVFVLKITSEIENAHNINK